MSTAPDRDDAKVTGLSIVLPAYNEEPNIEEAVGRALETGERVAERFEVIVVDDGSRDRTGDLTYALLRDHYPRLRLLRHPVNRGYGAALRTGFRNAEHDQVFFTDADNQFDIKEIAYFLPLMRQAEVVTGFRVYRYDSLFRLLASWGYNLIVGILFRVRVRDVDCSFKVFRREVLEKITLECDDFFIDTELIAKARKWNFRILEKGVRHYPRVAGETTVRPSDVPRTLRTVLSMWRRIHLPTRAQLGAAASSEAQLAAEAVEAVPEPHA